jgi:hypothetical protein
MFPNMASKGLMVKKYGKQYRPEMSWNKVERWLLSGRMYSNHLFCRGIYMPAAGWTAGLLQTLRSCFEKFSEGGTNPLGHFNKAKHKSHEDGTLR